MARWVSLQDICDVVQGAPLSRLRATGDTSFSVIQIADLDSLGFGHDLEIERLPVYYTPTVGRGDVLLSLRGSPIRAAVVPETMSGYVASPNIAVLSPKQPEADLGYGRVDADYLAGLLGSEYMSQRLLSHSSGGTVTSLSIRSLRKLKVPLPAEEIQRDFATAFKYRHELRASAKKLLDLHTAGLESELHLHLGDEND